MMPVFSCYIYQISYPLSLLRPKKTINHCFKETRLKIQYQFPQKLMPDILALLTCLTFQIDDNFKQEKQNALAIKQEQ